MGMIVVVMVVVMIVGADFGDEVVTVTCKKNLQV